jgi:hypothetical protein
MSLEWIEESYTTCYTTHPDPSFGMTALSFSKVILEPRKATTLVGGVHEFTDEPNIFP